MHSGEDGPVVKDKKQAIAVALSACGKSKYAETLRSMGYSEEVANEVVDLFSEVDWQKQFETGQNGPENPDNYRTGQKYAKGLLAGANKPGSNKTDDSEMLSGPALEKGPGNPQGGSSKGVQGMRALG